VFKTNNKKSKGEKTTQEIYLVHPSKLLIVSTLRVRLSTIISSYRKLLNNIVCSRSREISLLHYALSISADLYDSFLSHEKGWNNSFSNYFNE